MIKTVNVHYLVTSKYYDVTIETTKYVRDLKKKLKIY